VRSRRRSKISARANKREARDRRQGEFRPTVSAVTSPSDASAALAQPPAACVLERSFTDAAHKNTPVSDRHVFALMVVNVAVHTDTWAVEYRVRNPQVAPQKDLTKAKQCNQACSDAYQACLRSTAAVGAPTVLASSDVISNMRISSTILPRYQVSHKRTRCAHGAVCRCWPINNMPVAGWLRALRRHFARRGARDGTRSSNPRPSRRFQEQLCQAGFSAGRAAIPDS
jgi:hypothetical protein